MNCPSCHKILPDNTSICPYCGTVVKNSNAAEAPLPKLTRLKKITPLSSTEDPSDNSTAPGSLGKIEQPVKAPEPPITRLSTAGASTVKPVIPPAPVGSSVQPSHPERSSTPVRENTPTFTPAPPTVESPAVSPSIKGGEDKPDEKNEESGKKGFFSKSFFPAKKSKKSQDSPSVVTPAENSDGIPVADDSEDLYDTNYDGYYDDLIPDLAKQINKIPQENIIKGVLCVVFGVVACGIFLATM